VVVESARAQRYAFRSLRKTAPPGSFSALQEAQTSVSLTPQRAQNLRPAHSPGHTLSNASIAPAVVQRPDQCSRARAATAPGNHPPKSILCADERRATESARALVEAVVKAEVKLDRPLPRQEWSRPYSRAGGTQRKGRNLHRACIGLMIASSPCAQSRPRRRGKAGCVRGRLSLRFFCAYVPRALRLRRARRSRGRDTGC
jgi:hypothetical protein